MEKKGKHIVHWKNLWSIKGVLAIIFTSAGLWYIGSLVNIIPDTIPIVGFVDQTAFTIVGLLVGGFIFNWAMDMYHTWFPKKK
jgi:hypothetical protein